MLTSFSRNVNKSLAFSIDKELGRLIPFLSDAINCSTVNPRFSEISLSAPALSKFSIQPLSCPKLPEPHKICEARHWQPVQLPDKGRRLLQILGLCFFIG